MTKDQDTLLVKEENCSSCMLDAQKTVCDQNDEAALNAEDWRTYAQVFSFVGNELLVPMNRSGNVQGLNPSFWESAPVADNDLSRTGQQRLIEYAKAAASNVQDSTHAPGMMSASVEYAHFFIGPPSPAASPWETTNDPRNEAKVGFGSSTIAMKRLLAEEGLQLSNENNQYEDHIGIELLFLSALCEKGASEADLLAVKKALVFAREHPLSWIDRLRANVNAERPQGYYSALLAYVHGTLVDFVGAGAIDN